MFLGEFSRAMDGKGRLAIPSKYREGLDRAVITRGLDRNLAIYPMPEWERLAARLNELPITDPSARALRRLFFSGAVDVTLDQQGRVLIPAYLREYAGIDGEAVLVGMDSFIEVWSPEAWQQELLKLQDAADDAAKWLSLGI